MRKLFFSLALCSTAISTHAFGRDGEVYLELDGGGVLAEDFDLEAAGGNEDDTLATLEPEIGFDVGGILGYDFGAFRLELEGSYRQLENDALTTAAGVIDGDVLLGDSSAASAMVNALFDLGSDDSVQFYAGGGAGVAYVEHAASSIVDGAEQNIANGDTYEFAWQALAGVRYPLSDAVDIGLKYRFFNIPDYEFGGSFDADAFETHWRSHSLLATLNLNLGGRSQPAPVA
ncbi:porin family protein, partial [Erythrobacter litoralis]|uniref:outer membrane protein n=1 Tax=Erythrobacter litoralis TaxID=39960 RepID=UPI002435C8F6